MKRYYRIFVVGNQLVKARDKFQDDENKKFDYAMFHFRQGLNLETLNSDLMTLTKLIASKMNSNHKKCCQVIFGYLARLTNH